MSNLLQFLNEKHVAMDNDPTAQIIASYSYFSKAFDTVPHQLLIPKLCDIGVGGCFLDILYDYLNQRKQYVRIEDHTSKELQVTSGLPQCSLLVPLFFCIFINDLPDVLSFSQPLIFADNLKILVIGKSNQEVQTDIRRTGKWVIANKMKLAVNKRHLLNFWGTRACLSLNEQPLKEPDKEKNLGVYIADTLNWCTHIEQRIEKTNKVFNCLRRNVAFNVKVLVKLGL